MKLISVAKSSIESSAQTDVPPLPEACIANRQKNEEFKIWKRAVPSFYQHISTFKPHFARTPEYLQRLTKSIVFSDRIQEKVQDGLLETAIFCSLGNEIYKFKSALPLGSCYSGTEALTTDPNYSNSLKIFEDTKFEPTWISPDEKVVKIRHLDGEDTVRDSVIGITENGSLLWFKEDLRIPAQTVSESLLVSTTTNSNKFVDFDISPDKSFILRFEHLYSSQNNNQVGGASSQCRLCLMDNKGRTGDIIRTITFENEAQSSVFKIVDDGGCRFLNDKNLFGLCTSDNRVKFWDIRPDTESPICVLNATGEQGTNAGRLLTFDTSNTIDTLFATGSDTGVVKVWDIRAVMGTTTPNNNGGPQQELLSFSHFEGDDAVTDIQFSKSSATDFITVGESGSAYHWNIEYACRAAEGNIRGYTNESCLVFYHTGGFRGRINGSPRKRTAVYHPVIDGLVGCVDDDGLITVYKPFTGENEVNIRDSCAEN